MNIASLTQEHLANENSPKKKKLHESYSNGNAHPLKKYHRATVKIEKQMEEQALKNDQIMEDATLAHILLKM